MRRPALTAVLVLATAAGAAAQASNNTYVYFSTSFAETPQSGRGGFISGVQPTTIPTTTFGAGIINEAAVVNANGFAVVRPGVANMTPIPAAGQPIPAPVTDFVALGDFPLINLIMGDTDGDGVYNETTNTGSGGSNSGNFAGIDCLWIPNVPTDRAAGIHDVFISTFQNSIGTQGYRGTAITPGDLFLLPAASNVYPAPSAATPPIFFVRQSDFEAFFLMTPGSGTTIDLKAFSLDPATGDLYVAFGGQSKLSQIGFSGATFYSDPSTVASGDVNAGDIFRIPGSAYTPSGPYGVVTNPNPGALVVAERIYAAADALTMVTNAGGTIVNPSFVTYFEVTGVSIDPNGGGATTTTPNNFVVPSLFFIVANDGRNTGQAQNTSDCGIYSNLNDPVTGNPGVWAVINGVTMNNPAAMGMANNGFTNTFWTGGLDALCVVNMATPFDPVLGNPLYLKGFPDNKYSSGSAPPTKLLGQITGAPPGSSVAVFGRVDVKVSGGFIDRYSWSGFPLAGFPDLYFDLIGVNNASCVIAPTLFAPFGQLANELFNGGPTAYPTTWNPLPTAVSNGVDNGDTAFTLDFSAFGAIPAALSLIATFQAVDLTTLRVSTPMSYEFN